MLNTGWRSVLPAGEAKDHLCELLKRRSSGARAPSKNHSSLYRPNDRRWVKVKNPNSGGVALNERR